MKNARPSSRFQRTLVCDQIADVLRKEIQRGRRPGNRLETVEKLAARFGTNAIPDTFRARATKLSSGFTLIELLVVIAIIAVLAALLVPALREARASGQRAACMSNLHQMGVGTTSYMLDHEGRLFFTPVYHATGWPWQLAPYVEGRPEGGIYVCPGVRSRNPMNQYPSGAPLAPPFADFAVHGGWKIAYAINANWYYALGDAPRIDSVWQPGTPHSPAKQMIFLDGVRYHATSIQYPPTEYWTLRHGNGLNMVFVDGHTEYIQDRHFGTGHPDWYYFFIGRP